MPKTTLSDVGLRSLKPPKEGQIDYWDGSFKAGSFACRVSQGGTKTFLIKYRNRRITIGQFPTISLSEARTEAKRLLAQFTLGKVRPQSIAYQQATDLFLEEKRKGRKARTVKDYTRLLRRLNYKGQLAELTHEELQRRLKRFTAEGEYNHLLVALKIFCNWAIKRRYIEHNPTLGLSTHKRPTRSRVLTDAELKKIWRASEKCGQFGAIVRLLILTGQRRGEISALHKDWIDGDTCTLPKEITKNGREHTFPLARTAVSLLSKLSSSGTGSELIFPARGRTSKPFNGFSKAKSHLDKLSGVSDYVLHDARRSFATRVAGLGCPIHILERVFLNHVSGQISGVAAIYNRHTYLKEARVWIEKYERHLLKVVAS